MDIWRKMYIWLYHQGHTKPNQVCELIKSLYGLKQASRKWYEKLTSILIEHQFHQANLDNSLFIKKTDTTFTPLLVYVDDIILAGNLMTEFNQIKKVLHHIFQIKNLGQLKYFLSLEFAHSKQGITLYQRKYCLNLISDVELLGSKLVLTLVDPPIKLMNDSSPVYIDTHAYRWLVGRHHLHHTTIEPISHQLYNLSPQNFH